MLFNSSQPLAPVDNGQYTFYTDGSLGVGYKFNKDTSILLHPMLMVQLHIGLSSTRAEAAAVYAALMVTPPNSKVIIYTDSQAAIDCLNLCSLHTFSNSRHYYKYQNYELWSAVEAAIFANSIIITSCKVKAYSGNYWNDFADSLASTAHTSDTAILLSSIEKASAHNFRDSASLRRSTPDDRLGFDMANFGL
ncbi:hypothetical protein RhiirC2_779470 [Rhizophagus irregularis]|uniref:RNase H type-1 domain-containing protein n=1 Tax=Rhizophagus irregularis TaxID=588596 RepID=A0A2N1N9U2_9GLOM|nr:hypothetical protein RhiirC2_779470 [Rhizophagus irregularis]